MTIEELKQRLLLDLSLLNLPVDEIDLSLRPFSKTYYGNYFPSNSEDTKPRLWIYPYENTEGAFMSYDKILETGIHEMCHHIQYSDPNFNRLSGVMHDPQFWKLYNHYIDRANRLEMFGGVCYDAKAICFS